MQTRTSLLAKSTSILGATVALLFASQAMAQVNYSFNFDANATGWTGNILRSTTAPCAVASMRKNLYSSATTGTLITPSTGTALGGNTVTVAYDYKCYNYTGGGPTAAPWGSFQVQYGATATGPWTTIATIANEAQIAGCQTRSHTFTPPAGALFIRWNATWTAGDYYLAFDNVSVVESIPCGVPAPGNTVGPVEACPGANFTLSLQNATAGQTVSYQWYSSTASGAGPWTPVGTNAPTFVTNQVAASWYYCDVTCSVGPVTTPSNVLAVPMAAPASLPQGWSTAVVDPNCWAATQIAGTGLPLYDAASGFGVGTGSVKFDGWGQPATTENALVSPNLPPVPAGSFLTFDVAGCYYLTSVDQIFVEESNDGGTTWTSVVTLDNAQAGGVLNTAAVYAGPYLAQAGDWVSLSYPLSTATNRLRFRWDSAYGNNVYLDNVNVTPGIPAYHTTIGTGCYDFFSSALVQEFAGSPAAKTVLDGNSLLFVNTGNGYTAFWAAGGGAGYVAPTGGATTLTFADDDDGEVTITPSLATPVPGGVATDWTVSVNGILTAGNVANNLTDYTPTRGEVASATGLAFYTWRDWNAGEVGSGPIQTEEVGNMLYITWNGVEAYGTPSPNVGTWQFQVDMSNGNVTIVWVSFETSTSTSPVIVGATLAGASATPPSSDLTTVTPAVVGQDMTAMNLSVVGAPINNGPAPVYTISNIPEYFPGAGFSGLAVVFGFTQIPGGVDLGPGPFDIGAAGCNGYIFPDVIVIIGVVPFGPVSFPIPWSIPTAPGQLWMQAVAEFVPGTLVNGQNIGGKVTSNALEIYIANN